MTLICFDEARRPEGHCGKDLRQGEQSGRHQNRIGRHQTGNRYMGPVNPTEVQNDFLRVLNLGGGYADRAADKLLAFDKRNRDRKVRYQRNWRIGLRWREHQRGIARTNG